MALKIVKKAIFWSAELRHPRFTNNTYTNFFLLRKKEGKGVDLIPPMIGSIQIIPLLLAKLQWQLDWLVTKIGRHLYGGEKNGL